MLEQGKTVVYETERCYPDLLDLRSTMARMKPKLTASPEEIYLDFRATFEWLAIVLHFCHTHGRHDFQDSKQILTIAAKFIGRTLNEESFRAAVQAKNLKTKRGFGSQLVKVPDFSRVGEAKDLWRRHVEQFTKV